MLKVDKSDPLTLEPRSNPGAADSVMYELTVAYFLTGPKEFTNPYWRHVLQKPLIQVSIITQYHAISLRAFS